MKQRRRIAKLWHVLQKPYFCKHGNTLGHNATTYGHSNIVHEHLQPLNERQTVRGTSTDTAKPEQLHCDM